LKSLAKLFKPFNRDRAPLIVQRSERHYIEGKVALSKGPEKIEVMSFGGKIVL